MSVLHGRVIDCRWQFLGGRNHRGRRHRGFDVSFYCPGQIYLDRWGLIARAVLDSRAHMYPIRNPAPTLSQFEPPRCALS